MSFLSNLDMFFIDKLQTKGIVEKGQSQKYLLSAFSIFNFKIKEAKSYHSQCHWLYV